MELIDVDYRIGADPLFEKLNVQFTQGITGIIGSNGCGKSTLLRILAGLCVPDQGQVLIQNQNLYATASPLKNHIGYVPASSHLYSHLTVAENLYLIARMRGLNKKGWLTNFSEVIQHCSLMGMEKVLFGKCSDGIKKRIMIAGALINKPPMLILDEPCTKLDPTSRNQLWLLLQTLSKVPTQIFFTSHHQLEISLFCDHLYHLHQGRLTKKEPNIQPNSYQPNLVFPLEQLAVAQ